MVAIGFVLMLVGLFIGRMFCDPYVGIKPADWLASLAFWPGLLLVIAGITVWLFKVMP